MDLDILVPLAPFLMVLGLVGFSAWARIRSNAAIQKTIQKAIDKGMELNPETIKALGVRSRPPQSDLRGGLITIAVALGLIALGVGINMAEPDEQIIPIMAGVAAIPGFIGIALVIMHFFLKSDKSQ